MPLSRSSIVALAKAHPHSADLLAVFAPLMRAQKKCLEEANDTPLPVFDAKRFTSGHAWLQADTLPYTDAFLKKCITRLANAATKAVPAQKDAFVELKNFLRSNVNAARELTNLRLHNTIENVPKWAKKYQQPAEAAGLLAMLLGGTIAQKVEQATQAQVLPMWEKKHCPICGSHPHGSLLKEKEGKRYLHCSLCGHQWRYARTACPQCEQEDSKKLSLFFFEEKPEERAEACDACKHYLLNLDTRKLAETNPPLDLYFLCMSPFDVLMQEKGYVPITK